MREPLAKAELSVMDLLWEHERMTARELREALYAGAEKAQHGTIQRLLQRLEAKGYIQRDRSLAVHFFSATVSRQAYAGQQLEQLAGELTSGSIAPLITHLIEHEKISGEELQRLRDVIGKSARKGGEDQ